MARYVWISVTLLLACLCSADFAQAQFGGLQVRVGGYGTNVRVGGLGYGSGFYSGYGNGVGYGVGYGRYQNGYGYRYGQPSAFYLNGRSNIGYGYSSYPSASYRVASPRYYSRPMLRFGSRRFR